MGETKRKGIGGLVVFILFPIVLVVCVLVMYIMYLVSLSNTATTTTYGENITHSAMLDFTMLNTNLINEGSFAVPTQTCAKNTFLSVKEVIGIGLLSGPSNSFNVGYRGHQENVEIASCMSPFFSSLGYSRDIIEQLIACSSATIPLFVFIPSNLIPNVGHARTYVIYSGDYYHTPGIIADIANSLKPAVCTMPFLKALPVIGEFYGDDTKEIYHPKTTYSYITLPNEDIATVVTKTN